LILSLRTSSCWLFLKCKKTTACFNSSSFHF
jgi:hypothetical protein